MTTKKEKGFSMSKDWDQYTQYDFFVEFLDEGFWYGLTRYSSYDEIKDEKFHQLKNTLVTSSPA